MRRGGAEAPPRRKRSAGGLPAAAAGGAAAAGAAGTDGALAGEDAARLDDRELVRRLRRRRHLVRVGRQGGAGLDLDLARTAAPGEAGGAEVRSRRAERVVLLVGVARLDVRDEVTGVRLGRRVLAL